MKLFVNDKYVHILSTENFAGAAGYDLEISPDMPLSETKLQGRVLIWGGTPAYMDALLLQMEVKKLKKLDHVDFVTDNYDEVKNFIKAQFKIVKAGGGLVFKGTKMLMIYRLGKWDLPKGKLEKGEKSIQGALREVEEECAVSVIAEEKITSTWHTYVADGRKILKKTSWYRMSCISDAGMRPQAEEGIEDIRWMSRPEVEKALANSYNSIREVFATQGVAPVSVKS
jgi:8-oxo-dGTP pyrophosphatase MutT (NUDIX family)